MIDSRFVMQLFSVLIDRLFSSEVFCYLQFTIAFHVVIIQYYIKIYMFMSLIKKKSLCFWIFMIYSKVVLLQTPGSLLMMVSLPSTGPSYSSGVNGGVCWDNTTTMIVLISNWSPMRSMTRFPVINLKKYSTTRKLSIITFTITTK